MIRSFKTRLREWFWRYGPAEVLGTLLAVGGLHGARVAGYSEVAAAYAGSFAENIGFYGVILFVELRAHPGRRALMRIMVEFGPAEVFDTFLFRPLAIGLGAHWLGDIAGTLLGKLIGDVLFYLPVILTYEWRHKRR